VDTRKRSGKENAEIMIKDDTQPIAELKKENIGWHKKVEDLVK
jgi:hypothetical protein